MVYMERLPLVFQGDACPECACDKYYRRKGTNRYVCVLCEQKEWYRDGVLAGERNIVPFCEGARRAG